MGSVAALMLADGRFPCGSYAHSGGLEAAVEAGQVTDLPTLAAFIDGRLATSGRVAASFAAAAALTPGAPGIGRLDLELDARIASPALRRTSRQQGRALIRATRAAWPNLRAERAANERDSHAGSADGGGSHHAIALGAVAGAVGLGPADAARLAAYGIVSGSATAAVRLLGLDPLAVAAVVAGLADAIEEVVADAVVAGAGDPADLPCDAAPLLDIGAERHAIQEARLFAS
jgi:urease accessory protein